MMCVLSYKNSTGVELVEILSPGYKLDLQGTGRFTGNLTLVDIVGDDHTNISGVNNITAWKRKWFNLNWFIW